jgi:hypothetical protein
MIVLAIRSHQKMNLLVMNEPSYTCSACHTIKPAGEYHEDSSRPTGVQTTCKTCRSGRNRSNDIEKKAKASNPVPCRLCGGHRKTVGDGVCSLCLANQGLRFCRHCGEIKVTLLDFYDAKESQHRCIQCRVLTQEHRSIALKAARLARKQPPSGGPQPLLLAPASSAPASDP